MDKEIYYALDDMQKGIDDVELETYLVIQCQRCFESRLIVDDIRCNLSCKVLNVNNQFSFNLADWEYVRTVGDLQRNGMIFYCFASRSVENMHITIYVSKIPNENS